MAENCFANNSEVIIYTKSDLLSIKYTYETRAIVSVIMPMLMVFGPLINIAFLYVVYRSPAMRAVPINVYLVQLSVTDMGSVSMLCARFFHFYLNSSEYEFYPGTTIGCTTCEMMYFPYFVGVSFITMVTVERYFAICRPMQNRVFRGRSRLRDTSLVCWVLGFFLAVTGFAPQDVVTVCAENPDLPGEWLVFQHCVPSCAWCFHLLVTYDVVTWIIGFVINVSLFAAIISKLRKRVKDTSMPASKSTQQASKGVTRMLIANGIAFFILLGPYQIWNVVLLINEYMGVLITSPDTFFLLGWLSRLGCATNFALNPLIYGGTNPRYRKAFLEVFGCGKSALNTKNQNNIPTSSVSTITQDGDPKP